MTTPTPAGALYTAYRASPLCLVCGVPLLVRLIESPARKPFVMFKCPDDGRHFRAFVNDRAYVQEVLNRLQARKEPEATV